MESIIRLLEKCVDYLLRLLSWEFADSLMAGSFLFYVHQSDCWRIISIEFTLLSSDFDVQYEQAVCSFLTEHLLLGKCLLIRGSIIVVS